MCAVGPGDPISLEVCEHQTLPRGEQECFRITVDKRCVRPTYRRIAGGLEARFVRARFLGFGRRSRALGSVGAIRVASAPAGWLRTRSAWPMGSRI